MRTPRGGQPARYDAQRHDRLRTLSQQGDLACVQGRRRAEANGVAFRICIVVWVVVLGVCVCRARGEGDG